MKALTVSTLLTVTMALLTGCGNAKKEVSFPDLLEKAKAGDAGACLSVAQLYEAGVKGAPKDEKKAFEFYKKSAELGSIEARYNLSVCYKLGKGVEENGAEAKKWMTKAASAISDDEREKMFIDQAKKQLQ